jgi:parallel beta-helix repeat protein
MRSVTIILAVFIFSVIIQSAGAVKTITVCPSGCDNSTIQEAVDAASSGDTILVGDGTYTENVDVAISLNIQSVNGSNNAIVNASDPTKNSFNITANYTNMSGFKVIGATDNSLFTFPAGIKLEGANHCNISGNFLTENFIGVYISEDTSSNPSKYNIITGNNITSNTGVGIRIFRSEDNLIFNNYFGDNALDNAKSSDANNWNTTLTNGTNIIGGPFIGGNFWDSYVGADNGSGGRVAGDGIGDTGLPHDASGGISPWGDWLPLTITDLAPPLISDVKNPTVSDTSAVITWFTDEPSDSLVKFNTTPGAYDFVESEQSLATFHRVVLSGLTPNTTYYYVVNSTDLSKNSNQSNELSFTTGDLYTVCKPSGCDFTTIQDAIKGLNRGDRIFVFNGTYEERIDLNKSLTLQGQDRDTTIIDCEGGEICLNGESEGINISGFTVQNGSHGIHVDSSDFSIIKHNIVNNNKYDGIFLTKSNYGVISDNVASDNFYYYGIGINNSNSTTIENNSASGNWYGISIHNSCYSSVKSNQAEDNVYYGIYVSSSTCGFPPYTATIVNTTATGNLFGLASFSSGPLNISQFNFSSNFYAGIFRTGGPGGDFIGSGEASGGSGSPITQPPGSRVVIDKTWESSDNNVTYKVNIDNFGVNPDVFSINVTNVDAVFYSMDETVVALDPGATAIRTLTVGNGSVGDYEVSTKVVSQNDSTVSDIVETTTIITGTTANDSIIQNTYSANSVVLHSAVYDSNINNSSITRSIIKSSNVSDTSLVDVELENAIVKEGIISGGNITLGGITYEISSPVILDSLIIGLDVEDSSLVGVLGSELNVTAFDSNVSFQISTKDDYIGGTLSVQRSSVLPSATAVQANNLGGYSEVFVSENLETSVNWVQIRIYYDQNEVDSKNMDERSLNLQFFNVSSGQWEDITPGGVNVDENYVFANSSHFSRLGLKGDIKPVRTVSSSPSYEAPSVISSSGVSTVPPEDVDDLIRQFKYSGSQFFVGPPELGGALGALEIFLSTEEQADTIDRVTWKKVGILKGDIYDILGEYVRLKYPTGSKRALVSRGDLMADSLAAVAYAHANNIPIILVEPKKIPSATKNLLNMLGTEDVDILGGLDAVSLEVETMLPHSRRIGGKDRYETAVQIAETLMSEEYVDTVVITDGENPDMISVMIAVHYNAPIVYVRGNTIPDATRAFLESHSFTRMVLVGVPEGVGEEVTLMR